MNARWLVLQSLLGFFIYLSLVNTTCHFADVNTKRSEKKRGRERGLEDRERGVKPDVGLIVRVAGLEPKGPEFKSRFVR